MSLVLTTSRTQGPAIAYWGRSLGPLTTADLAGLVAVQAPGVPHSALDVARTRGLVGETVRGFTGTPALEGYRPGSAARAWAPRPTDWTCEVDDDGADAAVVLEGTDPEAGWRVRVDLELTREGVVRARTGVTNVGPDSLVLQAVRTALPVPARAGELLDLTGRWCRERMPQRRPWLLGTHLREGRHGRTGHDASLLLAAGTPGFGFGRGEVWATHLAWSGDHATYAERTPEGECLLGGGELLGPGEVELAEGSSYVGPWLLGGHATDGLDGVGHRLVSLARRRAAAREGPRIVLNTWEAAYFDHDLDRLTTLAMAAAACGVERFVLDDGWFRGRRHDRAGLGDWTVDPAVWPDGLTPLVETVHALGMDFGLWVEPEMVNEDSDLARAHPDWVLRGRAELPPSWRHQQVLDLQVPAAYAHVRGALLALLEEYDIAFLKWDHNRDLVDAAHDGRPAVHGQTVCFYRLLDEIRAAHPGLEIESCASGGGRIDAEVLSRTDRVWPSDTIDAVERQRIQTWTTLLVPPEMMGAHVGGPTAHTTGRALDLGFRAATALLGSFGVEWDLTRASAAELAELTEWIDLHRRLRPVLATGRLVRGDHPDPGLVVSGVVAPDATEGWYVVAAVDTLVTQGPGSVLLPGLDPATRYRVTHETPASAAARRHDLGTTWLDGGEVRVTGAVAAELGVRLPVLGPASAVVLRVVADA